MELFHAHNQWATRPADERFDTLDAMYGATRAYASVAVEKAVPWDNLRVEASDDNLALVGRTGVPAKLTHYAFGQLAARVGAPAGYLRALPPTLAAQNLNHGLKERGPQDNASLLFHRNGDLLLRAATSEKYARIWNYELIERLQDMAARFALVPACATMSWTGGAIDDSHKALYASDHDMFAFLMSNDRTIQDPTAQGKALRRGVIVINSEVGAAALKFMGFMFRDVCANHIIWGAEQLAEVSVRHVGDGANRRMIDAIVQVRRYMDGAETLDAARFAETSVHIADDREKVLDRLFGIRSLGLSRKVLAASYDAVVPAEDGDARSVWGMAQGITRVSQATAFADERTAMDRAAGKLLDFAF